MKIRKANADDAAGIVKVQVDSWRTTYRGIVPESYLKAMSYEKREERWGQMLDPASGNRNSTYVAETEDGVIVGFVSGGRERSGNHSEFQGECYAIYLLAEVQGEGLGKQLFVRLAEELAENGFPSMLVWVLADNRPARAFYEFFGSEPIGSEWIEIGEESFEEVAYGIRKISDVTGL